MNEALKRVPAEKVGRVVAMVCTCVVIALHVFFAMNAGALWRDEVNSVEVATMRTFSELWTNMAFDSFPALFFLVLRAVAGVPEAISDEALRAFGCGIGVASIAMIWLNARWLRLGFPLVTLALVGCNPMMVRYADSIRAYGLGMLLMLFSLGAIWRFAESCTRGRFAIALLAALLSVHSVFYNAVLLFATCMGAVAVTLSARRYKDASGILALGALVALSLLPYRSVMQRREETSFMWTVPFTLGDLWRNLAQTLASHDSLALVYCVALFLAALAAGLWMLLRKSPRAERSRLLFAVVTLVVGAIGYTAFLLVLSYRTRPWYYVVAIAFVALCLEMILSSLPAKRLMLVTRSAFALLFVASGLYPTVRALEFRQTNVDQIAATLTHRAQAGDLIVLNTWNYGISFKRYYHGPLRAEPVPPIDDLRSHRVDLIKQCMMSPAPITSVLADIEETLRAGKTVWLIGQLNLVRPGERPLTTTPGYDSANGFVFGGNYYRSWSEQIAFLFQSHGSQIMLVGLPEEQPVVNYEHLPLMAITGWQDAPLAAAN